MKSTPLQSSPADATASLSTWRPAAVLIVVALMLSGLVGRVAWLQTVLATKTADRAERQQHAKETLHARRGSIFDRNGLMLAGSVQTHTLFADPKFMHEQFQVKGRTLFDMDVALENVAQLVEADPDEIVLKVGRDPDKRYIRLVRGLSDETAQAIREMAVPGLGLEPDPERIYPMGTTAAHLLGAVGRDDTGLEGLERTEQAILAGHDGSKLTTRDKRRRAIAAAAEGYKLPTHGDHLVLTLDSNIQLIAEQELQKTIQEFDATAGSVIVMDPQTGDILALANAPTFFPQYLTDSTADARRNRAITDPFEPGSIVKPFLVAGMIERGVTRVDELVDTGEANWYRGVYNGKGRTIRDVRHYQQYLAVWDVLVKSSNIGMVKLGERIDTAKLAEIYRSFGFGSGTGVELSGENGGHVPTKWGWGDKESAMYGYAVLATPLQLCRAMAVLANGGRLVTPRLIAGHVEPGGKLELDVSGSIEQQVISPETARQVRRVLADAPVRGTATRAKLDRWNVFGKTATAHKFINGRQSDSHYASSFLGGAPFEAPRLVIIVTIHNADKMKGPSPGYGHHGGVVAGPCASRILDRALEYLDVPESPELQPAPRHIGEKLYDYERFLKDADE